MRRFQMQDLDMYIDSSQLRKIGLKK